MPFTKMPPRGPVLGDQNAEEWEKIKNWVGQRTPDRKDPVQQLLERKVQRFDSGGAVEDPLLSDPDLMKLLQPQGAGVMAPSMVPPAAAPAVPPIPPAPPAARPAVPAASPIAPPAAPAVPAAPAPTDAEYGAEASKILGGVTPESLAAMMQKNFKPSGGELAGMGLAGIGDAIASVGNRNPGALKTVQEGINKRRELAAKLPEQMAAAGKEKYGLEHELQTYDPNSPFSKVMQRANSELLKSMGATDADVSKLPAAAINDIANHKVELKKALAEIEATGAYRQAALGLQKSTLEATKEHEHAQEHIAETNKEQEAAKALSGRGVLKRAADWMTGNPATKVLERQAEGTSYAPDVTAYAQRHGISPEQAQAIKDKRMGGK